MEQIARSTISKYRICGSLFTATLIIVACCRSLAQDAANDHRTGMLVLGSHNMKTLKERVDIAFELYSGGSFDYIIVSGGCGAHGSNICEASEMAAILREKGIAVSKIFKEEKSGNTVQNYCYSRELKTSDGTKLIQPKDRLIVVSNHWHAIPVAARFTVYDGVQAFYHIEGNIVPRNTDQVDYTNIFNNGLSSDKFCN